jgi:hypothetical protein
MAMFELESIGPTPFEVAFKELLPAMNALRAEEIIGVNLSIPGAVKKALGVQPALLALKDRILDSLPAKARGFPDKVDVFARALSHAHTLYHGNANERPGALAFGRRNEAAHVAVFRCTGSHPAWLRRWTGAPQLQRLGGLSESRVRLASAGPAVP